MCCPSTDTSPQGLTANVTRPGGPSGTASVGAAATDFASVAAGAGGVSTEDGASASEPVGDAGVSDTAEAATTGTGAGMATACVWDAGVGRDTATGTGCVDTALLLDATAGAAFEGDMRQAIHAEATTVKAPREAKIGNHGTVLITLSGLAAGFFSRSVLVSASSDRRFALDSSNQSRNS